METHPKSIEAVRLMRDGILALSQAERNGIRIDMEYCERKSHQLSRKIEVLEKKFKDTKFYRHWSHTTKNAPNINSNQQLATFLYKVKKIRPPATTESGMGSTDEDTLSQLDIPEMDLLLKIRKLRKIKDTYLEAFMREQVNGFIHPFFNLHLVRTFRSSSDSPNFQNIPKRDKESMQICRRALFPRVGNHLMAVDFGSLEVRIATCYHNDPVMIKYIKDPTTDMHADMAREIYLLPGFDKKIPEHKTLRDATKNGFVFPQFYGDYYKTCAVRLACGWGRLPKGKWKPGQGVPLPGGKFLSDHLIQNSLKSLDDFTEHIRKIEDAFWNKRFRVYNKWKEKWWKEYQKNGHIDMLTGFRASGLMSKNDAVNYPVQGAAFHCLLKSFVIIDGVIKYNRMKTRLLGQIHDEIILDVPPEEVQAMARICKEVTCMTLPRVWGWINVPLEIEAKLGPVNGSWADMESFKLP